MLSLQIATDDVEAALLASMILRNLSNETVCHR